MDSLKAFLILLVVTFQFVSVDAKKKKTVTVNPNAVPTSFLDSLFFDYTGTIWGKDPDKPLVPLGNKKQTQLQDLTSYGVIEDMPLLTTQRTIFVDTTHKSSSAAKQQQAKQLLEKKDESHSHVGVEVGLGPSWMTYSSDFGRGKTSVSPMFGITYEYYISRNWGFHVGLDFSVTTGKFSATNFTDKYSFVDKEGDKLNFTYNIGDIEEKNKLVMMQIPVSLAWTNDKFFAHGGLKIGIPLKIKYEQTLNDCDFKCEIPAYGTTITHGVALALDDNSNYYEGKFTKKPVMLMANLEVGYKFHLSQMFDLGVTFYVDKAFYRMRFKAENDEDNVQYEKKKTVYDFIRTTDDVPATLIRSSVLTGQQMSTGQRIAESMGYTNFGIKALFFFNMYGDDYLKNKKR